MSLSATNEPERSSKVQVDSDPSAGDCILGRAPYYSDIEIKIRKAVASDGPVITDFNLKLAEETESLILNPSCVEAGVAALLKDSTKGTYYVAELEGAVAGQLMITYEWSDWRNGNIWWLQSVYVARAFRRRGVFRALFKHLQNLALANEQVCGLRLYMHRDNAGARRSYEELGMRHTQYEVFEMDFAHHGQAASGNPNTG